jgi:hypothetical protein
MKRPSKIFKLVFVIALIANLNATHPQTASSQPVFPEIGLHNCEQNSALLDLLANELLSKEERAFVIARPECGENLRDLNRRRLYNVRTYLVERSIDTKRLIFAEGERVEERGRIEVYVGSRLLFISLIKRNKDVCVICCSPDPAFYGQGKMDKPKRKQPTCN